MMLAIKHVLRKFIDTGVLSIPIRSASVPVTVISAFHHRSTVVTTMADTTATGTAYNNNAGMPPRTVHMNVLLVSVGESVQGRLGNFCLAQWEIRVLGRVPSKCVTKENATTLPTCVSALQGARNKYFNRDSPENCHVVLADVNDLPFSREHIDYWWQEL